MSALSIQPTFPTFADVNGQPLDNGYIWLGAANLDPQINPIAVYWDAALTMPAAQPIRTLAGYPSNNGTPARLYVNSDYSIRVMNKNGSVVYSAPAATERIFADLITGSISGTQVDFLQVGVGAVSRTVQDKERDFVSVFDFMTDIQKDSVKNRDGLVDVTPAIQAAIDSMVVSSFEERIGQNETNIKLGTVYLPRGEYVISSTINITEAIGLVLQGSGEGGTRILWQGIAGSVIKLSDCSNCQINNLDIWVDPSNSCDEAILILQDTALSKIAPTKNAINNVFIHGNWVTTNGVKVFFTGTDANNDFHEFNSCSVDGYINAGFYFYGLQSHCLYLKNIGLNGANFDFTDRLGKYGIEIASATPANAPSFIFESGSCGWHYDADFRLNGVGVNGVQIKNMSGENSNRLLTTSTAQAGNHIILENVRYASDGLNADGWFMTIESGSRLTCICCEFGTNGTASASYPKIRLKSSTGVLARFINCGFRWSQNVTGNNSSQFSPVYVDPTGAEYATTDVKFEGCDFTNQYVSNMRSLLFLGGVPAANTALDNFYGETTMYLNYSGATNIQAIRPAYPNQEVTLVIAQPNIKIDHAAGVVNQIFLKSGVDYTPTVIPTTVKLKFNSNFGLWTDI